MIGRQVARHPRREQRGAPHPFVVTHDPRTHAPNGLYRVWLGGEEIGRQLSFPSADDCERMLHPTEPRTVPPLPHGYSAHQHTRARKRNHAGEPDELAYTLNLPQRV